MQLEVSTIRSTLSGDQRTGGQKDGDKSTDGSDHKNILREIKYTTGELKSLKTVLLKFKKETKTAEGKTDESHHEHARSNPQDEPGR